MTYGLCQSRSSFLFSFCRISCHHRSLCRWFFPFCQSCRFCPIHHCLCRRVVLLSSCYRQLECCSILGLGHLELLLVSWCSTILGGLCQSRSSFRFSFCRILFHHRNCQSRRFFPCCQVCRFWRSYHCLCRSSLPWRSSHRQPIFLTIMDHQGGCF